MEAPHEETTTPVVLELYALDTTRCEPCLSALAAMHAAAALLHRELTGRGYVVATRVVSLVDAEQAHALGVVSSPTVRVDGVDVALAVQERSCSTCSDLAGVPIDCRSYVWQGHVVDHPPADLIVAAVREHLTRGARRMVTASQARPDGPTSVERFLATRPEPSPENTDTTVH